MMLVGLLTESLSLSINYFRFSVIFDVVVVSAGVKETWTSFGFLKASSALNVLG